LKQASERNRTVIREITINDIGDSSLKVTLWGQQAKDFSIDVVYDKEDATSVIVLFIG
jgi:hypothetical protein